HQLVWLDSYEDLKWIHSEHMFYNIIKKELVLVYFSSHQSRFCNEFMTPNIARLATEYRDSVPFVMIDIHELSGLAQAQNIKSVPSFIIFKGGAVVEFLEGANSYFNTVFNKLLMHKESLK